MPAPTFVEVTSNTQIPIQPVGSNVTLTCTVTLSMRVDVSVTVNTNWTGPDGFRMSKIAHQVAHSSTNYSSSAIVPSFRRNQSGIYACQVNVTSRNRFISTSGSIHGTTRVTIGKNSKFSMHEGDKSFDYRCLPISKWQCRGTQQ